jgi:hypothetical protein
LIGIVQILDRDGFHGHVGIVDRDFSSFVGETILSDNIIYTDENDLEVTIFASDVFERFMAEYCNEANVARFESSKQQTIREALLRIASGLGVLRCLSRTEGWNIDFEEMTYRFEARRDIEISWLDQISHLRGRSPGTSMPSDEEVEAARTGFLAGKSDPIKLVRGHDLCSLIGKGAHDVFGRAHIALSRGATAVEEVFRTAFSRENFVATSIFQQLRAWERRNSPFVVLQT